LRSWELKRRLGGLAGRMMDSSVQSSTRIDPACLSESEKRLFERVYEIIDEYSGAVPPDNVLVENMELFSKALEIIVRRAVELFSTVMPKAFGGGEIEEWYFRLHFWNFMQDLIECIGNVKKWSAKDREEFLIDYRQNDMQNKLYRLPRGGFSQDELERMASEQENEREDEEGDEDSG